MNNQLCNVCGHLLEEKVYEVPASKSLTSLAVAASNPTDVYFCNNCAHLQTAEYGNESEYYDVSYNILTDSDDEDQIYLVRDGKPNYRTEHQVSTLISKVNIDDDIQILDYGCAKSSTMAKLLMTHENADVYLYDISANYVPFWSKFLDQSKWSVYITPEYWLGKFDLVTSFFSLEHISNLSDAISKVKTLLKKGGTFYAVVPNFLTNIADMIVVDHPNHFTESSITYLLVSNGFTIESIDAEAHRGALVITAKLGTSNLEPVRKVNNYEKAVEIARFWSNSSSKITEFENENKGLAAAIYGAGFYGAFLAANITETNSLRFIIDQNPYLHGKSFFGKKVISPNELPDDIEVIYVGLNPKYAKSIIEGISSFSKRNLKYFYI